MFHPAVARHLSTGLERQFGPTSGLVLLLLAGVKRLVVVVVVVCAPRSPLGWICSSVHTNAVRLAGGSKSIRCACRMHWSLAHHPLLFSSEAPLAGGIWSEGRRAGTCSLRSHY